MNKLIVHPGGALCGSVPIGGAKNAALPILAACLLCDGPSLIGNLPDIRDVRIALRILGGMGVEMERIDAHTYRIDPTHAAPPAVADPLTGSMRASAYFLGACLGKFGEGCIGTIGGCDFGGRPIDQHVKAFAALGATVSLSEQEIHVRGTRLRGAKICFDTVSVGATVNAILAAVLTEGESVLHMAASEPHIADLAAFLNRAGADIRGAGTATIRIRGVRHLRGCTYAVVPDMIEAGTYLLAGAATRGAVRVRGVHPGHLRALLEKLRESGADVDCTDTDITVFGISPLHGVEVTTHPYPGFPTDLQPQMTAYLCTTEGGSRVQENIWQHRFRYATELQNMGAAIALSDSVATVRGTSLHGAEMTVPDLRAGAALLIAACAAEGESVLHDPWWLERGYENYVEKFRQIGADIREQSD